MPAIRERPKETFTAKVAEDTEATRHHGWRDVALATDVIPR